MTTSPYGAEEAPQQQEVVVGLLCAQGQLHGPVHQLVQVGLNNRATTNCANTGEEKAVYPVHIWLITEEEEQATYPVQIWLTTVEEQAAHPVQIWLTTEEEEQTAHPVQIWLTTVEEEQATHPDK